MDSFTVLNSRLWQISALILLSEGIFGQLPQRSDAYLLFEDTTSQPKIGYLNYPLLAETIMRWKNEVYAKNGIIRKVVLQQANNTEDTVAVLVFNKKGFILERDSFYLHDNIANYHEKLTYRYALGERKIKETKQISVPKQSDSTILRQETVYYYDKNNLLKEKQLLRSEDTLIWLYKNDTNGILTATKMYRLHIGDTIIESYKYEYDKRGRIQYVTTTKITPDRHSTAARIAQISGKLYPIYKTAYEVEFFEYNDSAHSIKYMRGSVCAGNYFIYKESQTLQNYCCPASINTWGRVGWQEKQIIVFDNKGRAEKVSSTLQYNKNLCVENISLSNLQNFKYDSNGLISEIDFGSQKTIFYYLKK